MLREFLFLQYSDYNRSILFYYYFILVSAIFL